MYIPPSFRISDPDKLAAFMDDHGFATLVTNGESAPQASHLPMRFYPGGGEPDDGESGGGKHGTLISHMARANPQWRQFESGKEVLAIFHGPHAYISPSWYETDLAVPTWNYAVVHAFDALSSSTASENHALAALMQAESLVDRS